MAARAGELDVEVHGQHLCVVADGAPPAAGAAVTLVVRPESLGIARGGTGLTGIIVSRTFLGEKAEYQVQMGRTYCRSRCTGGRFVHARPRRDRHALGAGCRCLGPREERVSLAARLFAALALPLLAQAAVLHGADSVFAGPDVGIVWARSRARQRTRP